MGYRPLNHPASSAANLSTASQVYGNIKTTFGATGTGGDDTAAFQAAALACPAGQTVFCPPGDYRLTTTITRTTPMGFVGASATTQDGGAAATKISGNFAGYLFSFPLAGIVSGLNFERMSLSNGNNAGGCIYMTNTIAPTHIRDLHLAGYRCLTIGTVDSPSTGNFTVLVENVRCEKGFANYSDDISGWGIFTGGQTQIVSADCAALDRGIVIGGSQVAILGGRYEVNKFGIVVGTKENGDQFTASGISIVGFSMENNQTGIYLRSAGACQLQGTIQGSVGFLTSEYGINIDNAGGCVILGGGAGGEFTKAAIRAQGSRITFIGTGFSNANANGAAWDVENPEQCQFVGTNYPYANYGILGAGAVLKSLGGFDQVRGAPIGKNLRGIDVAVTAAEVDIDIAFPLLASGDAEISTVTGVADGTSTLAAGTYYYGSTLVNECGETPNASIKTVTIASGRRVDVAPFGFSSPTPIWKRRIYRGTVSGVWDGYFEQPLADNTTFQDRGQSFAASGRSPPFDGAANAADGTEPDANYSVTVAPAWNTTIWITDKTTVGFTINFGTAPGADSKLDWHLIR